MPYRDNSPFIFSEFMVTISFIIFDFVTELDNQARSQGGEGGGGGGGGVRTPLLPDLNKSAFLMLCLKLQA